MQKIPWRVLGGLSCYRIRLAEDIGRQSDLEALFTSRRGSTVSYKHYYYHLPWISCFKTKLQVPSRDPLTIDFMENCTTQAKLLLELGWLKTLRAVQKVT
ncbi:hypothetical protein U9M48_017366 [Paspalum notatum var. saurae]|uniref:Uncharacterized protein n=1 Tax=Paspalum notatum var. saurae TaxID=547442 RepID=A0AAQ3WNS6_PASNO